MTLAEVNFALRSGWGRPQIYVCRRLETTGGRTLGRVHSQLGWCSAQGGDCSPCQMTAFITYTAGTSKRTDGKQQTEAAAGSQNPIQLEQPQHPDDWRSQAGVSTLEFSVKNPDSGPVSPCLSFPRKSREQRRDNLIPREAETVSGASPVSFPSTTARLPTRTSGTFVSRDKQ